MHGCPCGFFGDPTRDCRCTGGIIQRYLAKISGPLLDRIDLHIEVPAVPFQELRGGDTGASSEEIAARVNEARATQMARGYYNSQIPTARCASSAPWMRRVSGRWNWQSARWA